MFLNYPNNPTGAIAPKSFLSDVVQFCKEYGILLISDLAYGEVCFGDYRPYSIFNIEGAKDIAMEFHSFTKTFNMAGWRCGFAVGKEEFEKQHLLWFCGMFRNGSSSSFFLIYFNWRVITLQYCSGFCHTLS